MLTDDQIARLVQDFYSYILERENESRFQEGFLPDDVRERRRVHFAGVAAQARKSLASNRFLDAAFVTEAMLNRQGIARDSLSQRDLDTARQAVLRAGVDVAEALEARYAGDFNHEPRDKLLKARLCAPAPAVSPVGMAAAAGEARAPAPSPTDRSPLLSAVGEKFLVAQHRTKAWDAQTCNQAAATIKLMVDVTGDKPIGSYTRGDAALFRELVEQLPALYGKSARYRGRPVRDVIEIWRGEPEESRSELITQKTVKRHFSALSQLWIASVAAGDVSTNIFAGFKFSAARRPNEQRDRWTREELVRLFGSPVWTGCASRTRRSTPGRDIIRDEKYWLPLIALYSGLRQEEICQLQVDDIQTEGGICFFDINDRPPRKLKNRTAIRRVPIHSALVELGFLERLDEHKRRDEPRLFPDLSPGGADQRLGHAFTKWFTRYRRDIGIYKPGLDFHSFRHTATTLMDHAGVQGSIIDRVPGHATPGETARYTKGANLVLLRDAVETIDPGLDVRTLARLAKLDFSKA